MDVYIYASHSYQFTIVHCSKMSKSVNNTSVFDEVIDMTK